MRVFDGPKRTVAVLAFCHWAGTVVGCGLSTTLKPTLFRWMVGYPRRRVSVQKLLGGPRCLHNRELVHTSQYAAVSGLASGSFGGAARRGLACIQHLANHRSQGIHIEGLVDNTREPILAQRGYILLCHVTGDGQSLEIWRHFPKLLE